MWVKFLSDFNFRPPEKRRVCIAYKAGKTYFVRRVCGVDAVARGKAISVKRPEK